MVRERRHLAGKDKGNQAGQFGPDGAHDAVWDRLCAAVLAPLLQILLCWRSVLHQEPITSSPRI